MTTHTKSKEMILVSFFITEKEQLLILKKRWASRTKDHGKISSTTGTHANLVDQNKFGGCVMLLDPHNISRGFIKKVTVDLAFGILFDKKKIFY